MTSSKSLRLADYLEHIRKAITDIALYVEGMDKAEFMQDQRTQQAVMMNFIIMGEAANRILANHPEFTQSHAEIPWQNIRGMRNKMAHGYFLIDFDVVWNTIQTYLPELLLQLARIDNI